MATTVNNTTANTRITIIFDAGLNPDNQNDGPRMGTGNTESDVLIDNVGYYNVRSHTEIDADVHALQWNATTNTGTLEYVDNRENESLSSFPQWATNVVIRCEAQDVWQNSFNTSMASEDADVQANATSTANTERDNYLSAHGITY
jgi:cytochrome b involved in lipid metabolism